MSLYDFAILSYYTLLAFYYYKFLTFEDEGLMMTKTN